MEMRRGKKMMNNRDEHTNKPTGRKTKRARERKTRVRECERAREKECPCE